VCPLCTFGGRAPRRKERTCPKLPSAARPAQAPCRGIAVARPIRPVSKSLAFSGNVVLSGAQTEYKEHKTTFKVASAAGTEDQAVQRIKNPFEDRATRIDYFQLVRKWRVDLTRYGVRLTYDLVVPEPGIDILNKIVEAQTLQAELQDWFGAPGARSEAARFDLQPSGIRRDNYLQLAARYQATVDPPPAESIYIDVAPNISHRAASFSDRC
jgi:hypothetical protein